MVDFSGRLLRQLGTALFPSLLAIFLIVGTVTSHDGYGPSESGLGGTSVHPADGVHWPVVMRERGRRFAPSVHVRESVQDEGPQPGARTGQGEYVFEHRPVVIPNEVRLQLGHAHGGFAVDSEVDGGDGSVYFGLKGVGLLRLLPDLSRVEVVGGAEELARVNLHNASLFRVESKPRLVLPSDEGQRVFITDLAGQIVRSLDNPYGESNRPFRVCDVDVVGDRLFAVNGYADNVVFASTSLSSPASEWAWDTLRFGGRGTEHGRFGTAHGVTRVPGTNVMAIADRANGRIECYTPEGNYFGGVRLPDGCLPCDVDYHGRLAVVGCLKGPGGTTPAPIYILKDGNIVSELNVEKDLGLKGFTHIHNAVFRSIRQADGSERLFVIVYAWNPGNFAVLERVRAG